METNKELIGEQVTVYDRYLFAVPVKGYITNVSEKDGAFAVTFYNDNPGGHNVIKHNGKFFHHQQCRIREAKTETIRYTFTDKCGCSHADRIPIEVSPTNMERFWQVYRAKAEACHNYEDQKAYHKIADFFKHHFDGYKSAREKFDSIL